MSKLSSPNLQSPQATTPKSTTAPEGVLDELKNDEGIAVESTSVLNDTSVLISQIKAIYADQTLPIDEKKLLADFARADYMANRQRQVSAQTINGAIQSMHPQVNANTEPPSNQPTHANANSQNIPSPINGYNSSYNGMSYSGNTNKMNYNGGFNDNSISFNSSTLSNRELSSHSISFIDGLPEVSDDLFNLKKVSKRVQDKMINRNMSDPETHRLMYKILLKLCTPETQNGIAKCWNKSDDNPNFQDYIDRVWLYHNVERKRNIARNSISNRAPSIYDDNVNVAIIEDFFRREYSSLGISTGDTNPIRQYIDRVYPNNDKLAAALQDDNINILIAKANRMNPNTTTTALDIALGILEPKLSATLERMQENQMMQTTQSSTTSSTAANPQFNQMMSFPINVNPRPQTASIANTAPVIPVHATSTPTTLPSPTNQTRVPYRPYMKREEVPMYTIPHTFKEIDRSLFGITDGYCTSVAGYFTRGFLENVFGKIEANAKMSPLAHCKLCSGGADRFLKCSMCMRGRDFWHYLVNRISTNSTGSYTNANNNYPNLVPVDVTQLPQPSVAPRPVFHS